MNILIWSATEGRGPFQRQLPGGRIFSDLLTVKPTFSFSFVNLRYIEQANEYTIDGRKMTAAEQAEVYDAIQAVQIPLGWFKAMKQAEIMGAYQQAVTAIAGDSIDAFEIASWGTQEAQARKVLADAAAAAPIIDTLRVARGKGETKVDLSTKVVAAADAYA